MTEKLPDFLTVDYSIGDAPKEAKQIFMSAGLVRRLAAIANSQPNLTDVYVNPSLQSFMLSEVLKPRTPRGQAEETYELEDFNISVEEGDKVINWAIQHVINFFTKAVSQVMTAGENKDSDLMKLAASMTGLQALVESKLPAGPSTKE